LSRQISLNKQVLVTLSGAGGGQAPPIGPASPGEIWHVSGASVIASTNINEASAYVYSAPAGPFSVQGAQLLGATDTGSSGDSFGPARDIYLGQIITAIWQGGDAGAVATLTVWGTRTVVP
jgi:hypothetical protein